MVYRSAGKRSRVLAPPGLRCAWPSLDDWSTLRAGGPPAFRGAGGLGPLTAGGVVAGGVGAGPPGVELAEGSGMGGFGSVLMNNLRLVNLSDNGRRDNGRHRTRLYQV